MDRRQRKIITKPEDIQFLLNLSQQDVESLSLMMKTFGSFENNPPRFNTYDIVDIPPNSYGPEGHRNKNTFRTTVGRWWFNKCFIERDLFHIFGYINKPITKKMNGKINKDISYALMEDKITLQVLKNYLNRQQKFQPYSNILGASFSDRMLNVTKVLNKKKAELIKKYAKDLQDPEKKVIAASNMEKELLATAKDYLKDDPSIDMYNSGAKATFDNNFKNLFVMKGAIASPEKNEGFDIAFSNYVDGISKEEFGVLAKSLAEGPYARSLATPRGGYQEKLFLRAFQHLKLAPSGTDCHTKRTIELFLDDEMIEMMMYSYIVDGDKLVELTSENVDQYRGKKVKFRFSSMCEWEKDGQICNVCAGNLFHRLGFVNVGTAIPQVASVMKNVQMKAFHNSTIKLREMDILKAFGLN